MAIEPADLPAPAEAGVVLDVRHLRKRYGAIEAVKDVSFSIAAGETYGLLGPNGAGKTTTISMVCGLLTRDAGEVTLEGRPIDVGAVAAKAGIGYVPQELALYPDLSARENLRFFGQLYGLGGAKLKARIEEVLELTGLGERANDRTDHYSGGMQRRLNIGIGLLHDPRLLLLDEPTVGVDPQSRNAILESIAALGQAGMAILYTTHYMEAARAAGAVRGVASAASHGDEVEILADDAGRALPRLLEAVEGAGARVRGVELVRPDLEAVFLHLTGRALRDAE
jgi:ABC-2 type transport system ATP-binding protein